MADLHNIYCDESCHLEHDHIPVMVLGSVWCKAARAQAIAHRIRDIRAKHGLPRNFEVKWVKVSKAKLAFYLDLVEYFFDEDDLHFRGVLIDKTVLEHSAYRQTHDDWYYKMLFTLLEPIIDPQQQYRVYLDIKDTRSEQKRATLERVLRSSRHDSRGTIIDRVQQIQSRESSLMQMADLLIGAVAFHNRCTRGDLPTPGINLSQAKMEVVRRIQRRSAKSLEWSTWLRESKFNLLCWKPAGGAP